MRQDNIKFSIVVPIYGVEQFLGQCIESLTGQKYKNVEIILVDDGSKDNSSTICDYYAAIDNRIKVIHKHNEGLVRARQDGVAIATGDYIVCVDGDDWISTDYISHFSKIVEAYNPDVIVTGWINARPNDYTREIPKLRIGYYDRSQLELEIFPQLVETSEATHFPHSLWAKAFRRELYHQQQLVDKCVNIGEDGACVIPTVWESSSLYVMDSCDYYYRINPTSMTQKKKAHSADGPAIVHDHLANKLNLDAFDFRAQLYRKTVHVLFTILVSQFYKEQSYWKTRKEILQILSEEPYNESVANCRFEKSIAAKLMEWSLKYRIIFPIYLYSKIRK